MMNWGKKMARYVLVEFDNDAEAERFVNKIIQRCIDLGVAKKSATYRIRGFFAKPTKFCECGPIPESQVGMHITRGAKYGWVVHRSCKRARPMAQSPRNLLDPEDTPAHMRDVFLTLSHDRLGSPTANYPIQVRDQ